MSPPAASEPAPAGARPVLRFAPSPNGFLHLGHAYSALMNERVARRLGGTVMLRFEDIDAARCRPDYEDAAVADLRWLGMPPAAPILRQSQRFPIYDDALVHLQDAGLVYRCDCTRGDIARAVANRPDWPRDPDGSPLYPGTCRPRMAERRSRERGARAAGLRLDMGAALVSVPERLRWIEYGEGDTARSVEADPVAWGDALLARKDVPTSYHLAVVLDDAAQGVTDVVRGEDLFASTSLHRLLQTLLRLPAPAYHHHRLIRDAAGEKLSKSRLSRSLRDMRADGTTASDVRRILGFEPHPSGEG